jgi:4-amino-4-deoxy-L-arabinose transferase-like glycosyltransferase
MDTLPPRGGRLTLGPPLDLGDRLRRLVRGRDEPAWTRPAVAGVLLLTALLYVWGLDRNGWANTYYSAAVLAGTRSWKAFFYGALDAGSFITVDKPPASIWLMALSSRIFGFSRWSVLLPEALLGVATVGLVLSAVRRAAGPLAGLVAAVVMALTPVAVMMFRFNDPDALLTFLMVAAAWAVLRAVATGRTRWLLLSAAVLGLAFDTKYLQAFVVLPALVVAYCLFAPGGWGRRVVRLLGAAGVLLVSAGWWVAIISLVPASARPYIGGSTDNSVLDLVFGYDGLSRITGALGAARGTARSLEGGGAVLIGGSGGQPGPLRLFDGEVAGEIGWLLPLAGVVLAVGLWAHRGRPRPNLALAGTVLWGVWLLTHAVLFSFAGGIFHPYYTVAMAPAVAALVGAGAVDLRRLASRSLPGVAVAAAALLLAGWWGDSLLARTPDFLPWLGPVELGLSAAAAVALVLRHALRLPGRVATAALAAGLAAVLLGPAAYAVETAATAQVGSTPASGPASAAREAGPGGRVGQAGGPPAGVGGP